MFVVNQHLLAENAFLYKSTLSLIDIRFKICVQFLIKNQRCLILHLWAKLFIESVNVFMYDQTDKE